MEHLLTSDIPTQSYTSTNTNMTYPITTLVDCKSFNLVYQLRCKKCNAFYIGEMGHMFSKHVNGHRSTCMIMNSDLLVPIHTQSHQLPFQECWSVLVIHKLPDTTPTISAANLKQHTNLYFNLDSLPVFASVNLILILLIPSSH